MLGYYGYTTLLTYMNAVSAIVGIHFALRNNIDYAIICLLASGVFDAFDGIVAKTKRKRTDREKRYGIQIDSLADIVAFGILPVVIGCSIGLGLWWHIAIMAMYILACLIRLAFFNVTEVELMEKGIKRTHYTGLPVTSAAIILPLQYIIIPETHFPIVLIITLPVMSISFLVKKEVPKIRFDEAFVKFLYGTPFGRAIVKILIKVFVSRLAGWVLNRGISTVLISGFVKTNNIDMSQFKDAEYQSFNDFFTREIEDGCRPFPEDAATLPAPCDGKLSAYPITADSIFRIKKSVYDVHALLKDNELADEFMGGICLIFRLTPDDYHRYAFIDDGEILSHKKIKGVFHTVRPIAFAHFKVFIQNAREYTVMQTRNYGKVIQIEVGAMFVGKISNHKTEGPFVRGEEKGMFEFGGSTVILLFKKDAVSLDEAVFTDTESDCETPVKMGTAVGKAAQTAQ